MKLITRGLFVFAALTSLALFLGLLFVLTIGANRGSPLYRLKIAVVGLIVAIWGGGLSGCSDKPEGVIMCYAQVGDFADVAGMEEQPELVDANDLLETEEGDVPDLDEDEVMDDAGSDVMDVDECEEGSDADGEVIDAEFEEIDESEESVDAVDEDTADDAAHDPANEDI